MVHYQSDIDNPLMGIFKSRAQKEYYTNLDYDKVASKKDKESEEDILTAIAPKINPVYVEKVGKYINDIMSSSRSSS